VLGPHSGVFAVDVDGPEADAALLSRLGAEPLAPRSLSGSRAPCRYHLFFRHPEMKTRAKRTPWHPKLEFRGRGGVIILPPSLHRSGHRYQWAEGRSPDELDLPPLPAQVLSALTGPQKPPSVPAPPAVAPPAGEFSPSTGRFLAGDHADGPGWNDQLFRAACDLHGRGVPLEEALPLLLGGARPWDEAEEENARRTVESAFARPRQPGRW
jgi:hypothetical protein